jgi:hypothetical protein
MNVQWEIGKGSQCMRAIPGTKAKHNLACRVADCRLLVPAAVSLWVRD